MSGIFISRGLGLKRVVGFIAAFLVVCVVLVVCFGPREQNIFDEIASDTQRDGPNLSKIEKFKYFEHKNLLHPDKAENGFKQRYSTDSFDNKYSEFYVFYSVEDSTGFSVGFVQPLEDNHINLYFISDYNYEEKKLTQYVNFLVEDESGRRVGVPQDEAIDILRRNHIDEAYVRSAYREMLNDMFLSDWTVAYRSHYGPDDWGEVEVVEDYLKYFR